MGDHKEELLTEPLREELQRKWKEIVEPVTGCADYWSLRRKRHGEEEEEEGANGGGERIGR